jgi:hypothetical protein
MDMAAVIKSAIVGAPSMGLMSYKSGTALATQPEYGPRDSHVQPRSTA